MILLSCLCWLF